MKFLTAIGCLAHSFLASSTEAGETNIDPALPGYAVVSGVSGNLNSIGSDALDNLMTDWIEGFKKTYPNVNLHIKGRGSSTALGSLIDSTAQIGSMSRPMKAEEVETFEKKFGYKPTEVKVAIDVLAVIAHKDNPIKGLSMKQIDSIFSANRKQGGNEISSWDQAGLDAWKGRAIALHGHNSASIIYGFFQEYALGKDSFKSTVMEHMRSFEVLQSVGGDMNGLGYAGIGYKSPSVRALPLAKEDGGKFSEANYANALSGDYPLARTLYLYVNKKPRESLDKLTLEFLKFVLSKEGQQIVEKKGFYPMPKDYASGILTSLSK